VYLPVVGLLAFHLIHRSHELVQRVLQVKKRLALEHGRSNARFAPATEEVAPPLYKERDQETREEGHDRDPPG